MTVRYVNLLESVLTKTLRLVVSTLAQTLPRKTTAITHKIDGTIQTVRKLIVK